MGRAARWLMSHPAPIPAAITYDPVLRWPISTGPGLRKQQGTPIESQASVVGGPRPHGACAGVTGGGKVNTVVFTVVFCGFGAGCPSRGQPLRLAVQFCAPPRGGSEPQRLERGARSGSPHVAAALTLARPGGLRLRWLGAPRSRERKTSCSLHLRCQASWTDAG